MTWNAFPWLALCEENPPVTGGFLSQGPVMWNFDDFLIVGKGKPLNKLSSDAMSLTRRHWNGLYNSWDDGWKEMLKNAPWS